MAAYICRACERPYEVLGRALTHVERMHRVRPCDALNALWCRRFTSAGWTPAIVERE